METCFRCVRTVSRPNAYPFLLKAAVRKHEGHHETVQGFLCALCVDSMVEWVASGVSAG